MVENEKKEEVKQEPKEEAKAEGEPTTDTGDGQPVEEKSKLQKAEEISKRIDGLILNLLKGSREEMLV